MGNHEKKSAARAHSQETAESDAPAGKSGESAKAAPQAPKARIQKGPVPKEALSPPASVDPLPPPPTAPAAKPPSSPLPPEQGTDPLIGSTLHNTYAVDGIIGEGGMGRVYKARHTRIANKRFAIKVLHPEYALNPDLQIRFQREAEAAAAIEHAGVVGTYDVGRTPQGWPYMVSEYLAGVDLHSHIRSNGALEPETVVHVGRRLCEAISAAHQQSVIHRDMKPHNVFLVGDFSAGLPVHPRCKVLDFGLSRFVNTDSELTKTGIVLGTPGYMSPEQANGHAADRRTDVYGIGAVLFAAATGRAPFKEKTPQLTVLAVMKGEAPRPRSIQPNISDELEMIIQRAMARAPAERYQSAEELGTALGKLKDPGSLVTGNTTSGEELRTHGVTEAGGARLRLIALATALVVSSALMAQSSLWGYLDLQGLNFSPTPIELALILALIAALLAPVLWGMRHFQRTTWRNTAKVVGLLSRVRAPLIFGLVGYGAAALAIRFGEGAELHWFGGTRSVSSSWAGFSLIPSIVGVFAALSSLLYHWSAKRHPKASWLWASALSLSLCATGLALVALGFQAKGSAEPQLTAAAPVPSSPDAAGIKQNSTAPLGQPSQERPAAPPSPTVDSTLGSAAPAQTTSKPPTLATAEPPLAQGPRRAPGEGLAAAIALGTSELKKLAARYPEDPDVLKALVLNYASRASTLADAVKSTRQLLLAAPDQRLDEDLRFILRKAAQKTGATQRLAIAVMDKEMGYRGADLLYELMSEKKGGPAVRQALVKMKRRRQMSAALTIAYDLRFAPSCAARVPLLPRALIHGDQRARRLLLSLSKRPPRCGKSNKAACRATCDQEAQRFRETAQAISKRQGGMATGTP